MDKDEILAFMDYVENNNYRRVLYLRYVNGYSNQKIGRIMNYSVRHIQRMHKNAIEEIKKIRS